jgi:CheY-like chemotaxis protein
MIVHTLRDDVPRVHPRTRSGVANVDVPTLEGIHVLAVDDEPDALALVCEVLEAVGARVTTARSAEGALEKLVAEPPDVIVADLGMPHMDGFAFINRLRRHELTRVREIPAAALTAYARSEDRMRTLQAGFQIHLAKPIDPAELVTTIASLAKRVIVKDRGTSPDSSSPQ